MSNLSRRLIASLREIDGQKTPLLTKIADVISEAAHEIKSRCGWYNVKYFCANLPFFIKQAWKWRSWDYTYQIELFADALERSARSIKRNDNHVGADKTHRRAMTASGMLRKAYLDQEFDKSLLQHLQKRNPLITRRDATNPEQEAKMFRIIRNRVDAWEKQRKDDAWKYVNKHIQKFWD